MNTQLSDTVKALIAQARIVSFSGWETTHSAAVMPLFQAADDQSRYLTDEDLQQIGALSPQTSALIPIAQILRDRVIEIVDEARAQVLTAFPEITQPGGGLYPSDRAEACWRDFWHFLRCITYGIAGHSTNYTSETGLQAMQRLYQELHVPLDAMIVGVRGLKTASLKRVSSEQQDALAPYFDHLIDKLSEFTAQSER